MREKGKSAVQGHSEEGRGWVEAKRVAQKREAGLKRGFASVGAEEGHLALSRVKRKLPLERPRLEAL